METALQFYAVTPWYLRVLAFYALAGVIIGLATKGLNATVGDVLMWPLTAWGWVARLWTPKT